MTTLVEKVADAIGKAIRQSGYITNPEMDNHVARAAIATVLREMMEPTKVVVKAGEEADVTDQGPLVSMRQAHTIYVAMLCAFASEHGIELEKQS